MNLSGGEQQVLAIARTLGGIHLLLLDEPSEGCPLVEKSLGESFFFASTEKEMTILLADRPEVRTPVSPTAYTSVGKGRIQLRRNEGRTASR